MAKAEWKSGEPCARANVLTTKETLALPQPAGPTDFRSLQQSFPGKVSPSLVKPSTIETSMLHIGDWTFKPAKAGDLLLKFYFVRKTLVWELYDSTIALKKKMEFKFDDIK
jgi:hypothetical protein